MYEQFRNAVIANCNLDKESLKKFLIAMDIASQDYEFKVKEKALTVINHDEIPAIVRTYISCKAVSGQSKGTMKNALTVLKLFFAYIEKPYTEIKPNDIRRWLFDYQQQKQISLATLDKYRAYISSFFTWCVKEEYLTTDPSAKVDKIKCETKERVALTQVELEYLRKSCETPREKMIVEMLYSTGCRAAELVSIKMKDVDLNNKSISVIGKGRKQRTIYLNAKALVAMDEYLKSRKDNNSEYLITSLYHPFESIGTGTIENVLRQIVARTPQIKKKVTPHTLRHTFATNMLNSGGDIVCISKMLGHSNLNTTMVYAKASDANAHAQHTKYVV